MPPKLPWPVSAALLGDVEGLVDALASGADVRGAMGWD